MIFTVMNTYITACILHTLLHCKYYTYIQLYICTCSFLNYDMHVTVDTLNYVTSLTIYECMQPWIHIIFIILGRIKINDNTTTQITILSVKQLKIIILDFHSVFFSSLITLPFCFNSKSRAFTPVIFAITSSTFFQKSIQSSG